MTSDAGTLNLAEVFRDFLRALDHAHGTSISIGVSRGMAAAAAAEITQDLDSTMRFTRAYHALERTRLAELEPKDHAA